MRFITCKLALANLVLASPSFAGSWLESVADVQQAFRPEVSAQTESLQVPISKLQARIKRAPENAAIEPVYLTIKKRHLLNTKTLEHHLKAIAKPEKFSELFEHVNKHLAGSNPPAQDLKLIADARLLELVSLDTIAAQFVYQHYQLSLDSKQFVHNKTLQTELFHQIRSYLPAAKRELLKTKISQGLPLQVDTDLLPSFAQRMVKQFIVYRGPNCFHASLSFQNPNMPKSSFFNVRKEKGYHRSMINYDELWAIMDSNFYEVDVSRHPIKYGDVIVFFERPQPQNLAQSVDFHWIRHATTYLFSGYTFAKGSKSPNSPYMIQPLAAEWETWQGHLKNIGAKVFRKTLKNVSKVPPKSLIDWIY